MPKKGNCIRIINTKWRVRGEVIKGGYFRQLRAYFAGFMQHRAGSGLFCPFCFNRVQDVIRKFITRVRNIQQPFFGFYLADLVNDDPDGDR